MTLPRPIVADPQFMLATRDTGYRGVPAAIAELIDNAVQAEASDVRICVREERPLGRAGTALGRELTIGVLDNGHGMDHDSLWTAVQFGGTERFNDRSGLGRFGMGLPNSSVSVTRRLEVYSWRRPSEVLHTYLDIDEVAQCLLRGIPEPEYRPLPLWAAEAAAASGTLVVWPGVAEELLGAKAYFVRAGIFRDVDAVLFTHVGDAFETSWGLPQGTGLISVEYTFQGESSHAAARPWRGRNALRAVELMNIGWDFRREQLRPEQRSHYVITNGGDQPNVIPPLASVWYFFREIDFENIKRNYEIGNKIAEAAAMMTDTTVTRKVVGVAAPRHFNKPIAEAVQSNVVRVGMPQWTDEEQAFAKAVQRLVDGAEIGLNTEPKPLEPPPARPISGGSDDIGDVSWVAPTVTVRYPANIPNLPGHNWSNAIAMATPIAHKGVVAGAKVIAMTLIDLLTRPELVREARTYFTDVQLKNNKVLPLLADTDMPQIQLNRETMERYRPQMRTHYFDSAKYDTYLDQLGVKFPTVAKAPAP